MSDDLLRRLSLSLDAATENRLDNRPQTPRRINMATDFTAVLSQRQHLGNERGNFNDVEPNVLFVGPTKDFTFNCPSVNPGETAFLMFQSRDVDHQRNIFRVNGVDIFGDLPA